MRPKLLLLDETCDKARQIFEQEFDCSDAWECPDLVYTQLTPIETFVPVICPCTGIDHIKAKDVIYLDDAWKRGEGRNVTSTAEHTWSLILQLAKMKRMQLSGKILGIIGYGRIGSQVGRYAKAFDMEIKVADNWRDGGGAKREIFAYADIITLHVPLTESTKGMIGKREFDMMKPGALLVNTSRAEVVDINELINALTLCRLGGYADDFEGYHIEHAKSMPDDLRYYYDTLCDFISTPHVGGNCREARESTDIYIAKRAIEHWRSMNP